MHIIGIVTCFNRKDKTINSIRKLIDGNPEYEFNFIVVDDCSKDGTAEALKDFQCVTVLNGTGGLYYSGGMRKGIAYVKDNNLIADYVLFFNDDVDFYPEILDRMKNYAVSDDVIVVGVTESGKGKLSYGGVVKKSRFLPKFEIIMSGEEKVYCDTFNANCVLIPFDVFSKLPNIDEAYGHSIGDYDYGLEASRQGFHILATNFYVGRCDDNPVSSNWLDTSKSRRERLKQKESIKGLPRKTWFHFCKKNYGIMTAIISTSWQYIKLILNK